MMMTLSFFAALSFVYISWVRDDTRGWLVLFLMMTSLFLSGFVRKMAHATYVVVALSHGFYFCLEPPFRMSNC